MTCGISAELPTFCPSPMPTQCLQIVIRHHCTLWHSGDLNSDWRPAKHKHMEKMKPFTSQFGVSHYGSLSSLIFPGIPMQWWHQSQVWNTPWPVPSQPGKIPDVFPKQLCWHWELERATRAPTRSIQSAKNPFNTTSASPNTSCAPSNHGMKEQGCENSRNQQDSRAGEAEVYMVMACTKASDGQKVLFILVARIVYPHSKCSHTLWAFTALMFA